MMKAACHFTDEEEKAKCGRIAMEWQEQDAHFLLEITKALSLTNGSLVDSIHYFDLDSLPISGGFAMVGKSSL